jgi:hypothetical protein
MVYIYTEGKDKLFIQQYTEYLGFDKELFKVIDTEGKDKIFSEEKFIKNLIPRSKRVEDKNFIIFDLDDNDDTTYKASFHTKFNGINPAINIDNIFLFNRDFEELLLSIMIEKKRDEILSCFEDYQECVSGKGYLPTADKDIRKAQVFTYLEALGEATHFNNRTYTDSTIWDIDSPNLAPLKTFIESLF